MFGVGPTEFIIIGVMALMLFSPRELPKMLRTVAKFWASLRNTADEFRDAIMNEEELQDIRGMLKGGASDLKRAEAAARRELMKARMEMQKAQNKLLNTVKASEAAKREELAAADVQNAGAAAIMPAAVDQAAAHMPAPHHDAATSDAVVTAAVQAPVPEGTVTAAPPGRGAA